MTTTILALSETNTSMLTRIAESLHREHCRVQYCDGTLGAHEQIQIEQPDVVLAAHWLEPRGAGWRLIEELSWDPRTQTIPIIVAANRHTVDRERDLARELGCVVIDEPVDVDLVLALARNARSTVEPVRARSPDRHASASSVDTNVRPRAA